MVATKTQTKSNFPSPHLRNVEVNGIPVMGRVNNGNKNPDMNTGWLVVIFIMACYNPHITG